MRPLVLLGLFLLVIGGFLFYQGGALTTREKVVEVGDVRVTAPEKHSVPLWIAGAAVVVGLGFTAAGVQHRGRA